MPNQINSGDRLTTKSHIEGYMTIEEMTKELHRLSAIVMNNPEGEFPIVRSIQLASMKALIKGIENTVDACS